MSADSPHPEQIACALACGLENLSAGNAAIIDHLYSPITEENVYGVAQAYESLGIRAWVFPNIDNLPVGIYTRRFYPNTPRPSQTIRSRKKSLPGSNHSPSNPGLKPSSN